MKITLNVTEAELSALLAACTYVHRESVLLHAGDDYSKVLPGVIKQLYFAGVESTALARVEGRAYLAGLLRDIQTNGLDKL